MKKSILFFILTLFVFTTCNKDNDIEEVKDPATDYMEYTNEGKIGAGGGQIIFESSNSYKGASVEIPEGALTQAQNISIKIDNSKRPTGDDSSNILKFEPEGLTFLKTVTLKIPVDKNISNPVLLYFIPDSMTLQQVPILEFNQTEGYIRAEINHFSRYLLTDNIYVFFDGWLYNSGNTIKAKIKFGGNNGLQNASVTLLNMFTSGFSILNAKQAIDYGIPYNLLTGIKYPEKLYASITVKLKGNALVTSYPIKTIKLAVQRKGEDPINNPSSVVVYQVDPEQKVLFTSGNLEDQSLEDFFSGKALIFDFNVAPESGKKYYLEIIWVLADSKEANWLTSSYFTDKYELNTYGNYEAWTTSNMLNSDPDKNKNFVDDNYDVVLAPVADFTVSTTTPNVGQAITFTDKSTNTPTSWSWTFGDGTTSTQQNPSKTYNTAGTYTVSLKATNSFGNNTKTITNYVTVSQAGSAPIADFSASTTSPTVGQTITFTDKSTNTPTSWSWTFGDGTTSTQQNPSKTYNTAGTYTVSLKATNSFGNNTKTITNYITVSQAGSAPIADFSASTTSPTVGQTITFTDKSTNSPTSWLWNFGDGATSTSQNSIHTYTLAGTYTVTLKATNSYGDNVKTITVNVVANVDNKYNFKEEDIGIPSPGVSKRALKLTFIDIDGDTDQDLFIGDQYREIMYYKNIGDKYSPKWELVDENFQNTLPNFNDIFQPNIGNYISLGFSDVDSDGDYDMLVMGGVRAFYRNVGNNNIANWKLEQDATYFQNVPKGWDIQFTDIDGDSKNEMFFMGWSRNDGSFLYTLNEQNVYTEYTNKYVPVYGQHATGEGYALFDIDSDGDVDMVGGGYNSWYTCLFINNGTSFNPIWQLENSDLFGVNVFGKFTAIDIDSDGDYDLFMGDFNGKLRFYRNMSK